MKEDNRQWLRAQINSRIEQGIFQASDALLLLEGSSTMQDPELAFKICEKLQESSYKMASLPHALKTLYRTDIFLLRTIETQPTDVVNLLSATYAKAKIEKAKRLLTSLQTKKDIEDSQLLIQAFELLTTADKLLSQENKLCETVFTQIFQPELRIGSRHKELVDFLHTRLNLQITLLPKSPDRNTATITEEPATSATEPTGKTSKRQLVLTNSSDNKRKKPTVPPLASSLLKRQESIVSDRDTQSPHQDNPDMQINNRKK